MTRTRADDEHDPEQQFRALYDGNFAAVLGYALRRVEQPADAADVVSEVFLVAWRRLPEAPPGDARPWLFGTARHVLANYHRRPRRRHRLGGRLRDTLARDVAPDPATGVAEWDRIRSQLMRRRPDERERLMLVARQRVRDLGDPGDAPGASVHVPDVPFEPVIGESR